MKERSFMSLYGGKLVANGYAILPLQPGAKKPGRFVRGEWRDYPDWTRHAERATTDVEMGLWEKWPDAGVGVVGGNVAAVDIDIKDDPDLALRIEELARVRLGDTPAVRIGKAPKRMLIYRTTMPFKGVKRHPLEILCLGQQFVAYAQHPETGRPYEWPEETLADLDIEKLPAIDETAARAFLEEASALLPESIKPVRLASSSGAVRPSHTQAGTLPAIRAALAFIPNAELDYDSWVRIGLAIKGALGEAGAEVFASWSAQAAKNDAAFTARTWAGFKPNSIGAGTIYHLAMQSGWKPDAALVLDGDAPIEETHPAAGFLAKLQHDPATPRIKQVIPPPPGLDRLDGALALLVDHILRTAIRPQPWLAVGAALVALGAVMGRKVKTESGLRSNLYVLGIAESGGGKDHARKVIKELFVQTGLSAHLGGERLASGAGLITALAREPASLFQIDEFGRFMSHVVDRRRAPKHLAEIWDLFTELATSSGTTFFGAEYSDQTLRPRVDIVEPCACVHGVTAPGPFWQALNSGALEDGSIARFLVFRADEHIPDRNRRASAISDFPSELIDAVHTIANVGTGRPIGNLASLGLSTVRPNPLLAAMDDDARAVFDDLDEEMTRQQRAAIGTDKGAVLARVWENAAKAALIKAVSANPASPIIRGVDAVWARELVEHCAAMFFVHADRHLADNEIERMHKRVLELIRAAGRAGMRHNDLTRKCQFIDPKLRREIVTSLIESEQIHSELAQGRGRRGVVYRSCEPTTSNVHKSVI